MAGRKFGLDGRRVAHLGDERAPARARLPAATATSRIVVFSTGNVYGLTRLARRRRQSGGRRAAPLKPTLLRRSANTR